MLCECVSQSVSRVCAYCVVCGVRSPRSPKKAHGKAARTHPLPFSGQSLVVVRACVCVFVVLLFLVGVRSEHDRRVFSLLFAVLIDIPFLTLFPRIHKALSIYVAVIPEGGGTNTRALAPLHKSQTRAMRSCGGGVLGLSVDDLH